MDSLLQAMGKHPILTILIVWAIAGSINFIIGRLFRFVMVGMRGWPPAHLDADGDFKKVEKTDAGNE